MTEFRDYLLRMRKGSAASVNVKKLKEILSTFDGWKTEDVRIFAPSDSRIAAADVIGVAKDDVRHDLQNRPRLYVSAGRLLVKGNDQYENTLRERDEKNIARIEEIYEQNRDNTLPDPGKLKSGSFVTDLTLNHEPTYEGRFEDVKLGFRLYVVVKAVRVIAPNGKTFDVYGGRLVGMLAQTPDHFLRWAIDNTDIMETILDKLGMSAYVPPSERVREAKDDQTLGTCAICGNRHVVHGEKLVLHGYRRPGYGFIVGNCFGVDRDAYEISPQACRDYLGVLDGMLNTNLARIEKLQNDEIDTLYYTKGSREVKVERNDADFERVAQMKIDEALREISMIETVINETNEKIAQWKPRPLIVANEKG